jgi:hypothetical protein
MVRMPSEISAWTPAPTITAPISPPNNECDALDGTPKYQVITFQLIAESMAAKMTDIVIWSGWTKSEPMVLATAVPNKNGPTNSAAAATDSACLGRSDLDAITVATTLALLWKPSRKPNTMAMPNRTRNVAGKFVGLLSIVRPHAQAS